MPSQVIEVDGGLAQFAAPDDCLVLPGCIFCVACDSVARVNGRITDERGTPYGIADLSYSMAMTDVS
jgi:hypothetical protein